MLKRPYKFLGKPGSTPKAISWVKKDGNKFLYPPEMDKTMIPICDVINSIPGAQTISSCAGHFTWKGDNTVISVAFDRTKALRIVHDTFKQSPKIKWRITLLDPEELKNDQVCIAFDHVFDCSRCRNRELDYLIHILDAKRIMNQPWKD